MNINGLYFFSKPYLGVVTDNGSESFGKQTTGTTIGASQTALVSLTAYAKQTYGGCITTSTNKVDSPPLPRESLSVRVYWTTFSLVG